MPIPAAHLLAFMIKNDPLVIFSFKVVTLKLPHHSVLYLCLQGLHVSLVVTVESEVMLRTAPPKVMHDVDNVVSARGPAGECQSFYRLAEPPDS